MKNLKEKQLLVNFAKAFGQEVDESISKDVNEINDIKLNALKSIKENSFKVLSEAFKKAKEEEKKTEKIEYPLPPSLDDVMALIEETEQDIKEVKERDIQKEAVDFISKTIKEDSYQQPVAPVTSPDISSIQKKIQFLEQWISKISLAGPGSGETKFRFLDDIDRDTIGNTDQILRYRPASPSEYGKFFFGNLSGDQGPIRSMQYDINGQGEGANVTAGLVAWNSAEDCLNVYQNNTVLQVGLENYIRVHNHSGNTIPNGTFVQFAGVDLDVDAPLVVPYINNVNNEPLYSVGVLTEDLYDNSMGKATTLGVVRNIDTTGNVVGETWQLGDILWASPEYPGKFTKFKPTSPNVSISVAAVIKVDEDDGHILVRPTIWPRFYSGDFYSTLTQRATNSNEANQIAINQTLFSSGVQLTANTFTVSQSGLYRFDVRCQITSTNSSQKSISIWFKKNDQNVPYSAVRKSSSENGGYAVLKVSQAISLEPTDNVKIFYAVTDTSIFLESSSPIDGSANVASVQVMVTQPSL